MTGTTHKRARFCVIAIAWFPDDGVLVLIEYGLGDDNTPSLGKMVDLVMLTITGGKERTVAEHRALLARWAFGSTARFPFRRRSRSST